MQIIEVSLPNYTIKAEPAANELGSILDDLIKQHFLNQPLAIRGIASSEHPNKSQDELIGVIQTTGTDRYDPDRIGDRYDNIEDKRIDLFAFPVTYNKGTVFMQQIIWGFYHSAIEIHGYPMKIDIISIYDATKLTQILHQYEGRNDIKDDGFVFKDTEHEAEALLSILKII